MTGDDRLWERDLRRRLDALAAACNDLLLPGLAPHSVYTLSEERLRRLGRWLDRDPLPCTIHAAESPAETAYVTGRAGPLTDRLFPAAGWDDLPRPGPRSSVTALLQEVGLLSNRSLLAHGVHLGDEDAELLARCGAAVALCVRSNRFLKVGDPPVARLRRAGVRLAVGTDSLASNTSLSLWDEMAVLAELWPEEDRGGILAAATLEAARALGLGETIGSVEAGKAADLVAVPWRPGPEDPTTALVTRTRAADVELVMVAGRVLLDRTGQTGRA